MGNHREIAGAVVDPEAGCYVVLRKSTHDRTLRVARIFADSALVFTRDAERTTEGGVRRTVVYSGANRVSLHAIRWVIGRETPLNGTVLQAVLGLVFCVSGAAQEVPRLYTVDPPIFHSAMSSDTRVSEIGYLRGAKFLDPDQVVFLDTTIPQLVFVAISGTGVESAGRGGDGPGEFRMPFLIGRQGDAAVVWDRIHRRLTLLSADGAAEQARLRDQPLLTFWSARVVARFADGTVVTSHAPGGAANPVAPGRSWRLGWHRDLVRYRALVPGELPHVIVELLGHEAYAEQDGKQRGLTRVIFGNLLLDAQVGNLIAVSQTDLGVVHVLDRSGAMVAEIPLPPGIRVSGDQIKAEQENARNRRAADTEAYARMGFPGLGLEFRDFPANEVAPPIDVMRGDLDGRLWLRAFSPGADREHWQVWDVSGPTLEFTLTLPIGEEFLDAAGSRVLLRAKDELDVDYLLVREIEGLSTIPRSPVALQQTGS